MIKYKKLLLFVLLIIVSIVSHLSGANIISTDLSSLILVVIGALFSVTIKDMWRRSKYE